jgi:3-oxoacyl-[acyl-carrier protein] reductase
MNRVALITGASRGIGRGVALELARIGWDLAINYADNSVAARQTETDCLCQAGQAGLSIRVELCQADISVPEARTQLIDSVRQRFDRLDLLVNNAGVAPNERVDLLDTDETSFDRLMRINVKGPLFLSQLASRWMIELRQKLLNDYRPQIVTISSISAYAASINRADYCISKAALSMLTPLFADRLAEYGIRVYEIRPGIIATDMTKGVRDKYDQLIKGGLTPLTRWGQPEDVGKAVSAIAQDLLPFSTGEVINVDGGFHLRRL